MASPNKVSPSDCDNDRQPELAMWSPKPEILISPELWQFQRQIWSFRPRTARRTGPSDCDNDRQSEMAIWTFCSPILQFLVVDRCRSYLANLLSSSTSSKIPNLALEFRRHLSEFQRCYYFRFWGPYRYFRLSSAVVLNCQHYFPPTHALIPLISGWNLNCTFHSFRDTCISGFGRHFWLLVIIGIAKVLFMRVCHGRMP